MIKFWKTLKYWLKGGIVSIIVIVVLLLLFGLNNLISNWNNVYQNRVFHCSDFKGFNWTPCSFWDAINDQVLTPVLFWFGFPIIIFALFQLPIKSDFGVYLLIIISLLIGASFYFGIGALIAFAIHKTRKIIHKKRKKL